MTRKNLTVDPKSSPNRKKSPKPEQNFRVSYKESQRQRPKVQHPSSYGLHVQKISQCLPEMLSLFHVSITALFLLTVYTI